MAQGRRPLFRLPSGFRAWWFVWAVVVVLLVAVCAWALITAREQISGRAAMIADDILSLAENAVQADIQRYDNHLGEVIDAASGPDGPGTPYFGWNIQTRWARDLDVQSLILVDSAGHGHSLYTTEGGEADAALVPGLLHQVEPDSNGVEVVGVRPPGRSLQVAIIRRCEGAHCGKVKAAIAFLSLDWIKSVFAQLHVGVAGEAGLLDPEGHVLADTAALSGIDAAEARVLSNLPQVPRASKVVWQDHAFSDGVARRVSASWVGSFPLVVFVSFSLADLLRGWHLLASIVVATIVVMLAGFLILTVLLLAQLRKRMRVEHDLRDANHQLRLLASTDGLTSLLNRRGFDEAVEREWRRCRALRRPISLLMIDADNFKLFNDHFGHQAGDEVLRAIAACVEACIRKTCDIAARYGGEEMVVILPETAHDQAASIAERIRAAVEKLGIAHVPGRGFVTVSIGIGHVEAMPVGGVEMMLAAADAALYQSKSSGRNRVSAAAVREDMAQGAAPASPAARPA
jgi:diguanylate cyclase (GGDEF)-like protein